MLGARPDVAGMFIDGASVAEGSGGDLAEIRDPSSGQLVGTVPRAGQAEVDRAIDAAQRAFGPWASTGPAVRGSILRAGAEAIMAQQADLARLLTHEQGKPLREATIEIARCAATIEHYAGLAKDLPAGSIRYLDDGSRGQVIRSPLGVVVAIVPWNFPTTLLANKLGPALACGNTVVAKPSETTPLVTLRIAALLHEAGLPAGVLNIVTGSGAALGDLLVTDDRVAKVAFTGSTTVGKRVMELAARGIKRVTLELGGSDPFIILEDADLDGAISAASVGRFFNAGQACLAVKRLYVDRAVADEVVERLIEKARRLRLGSGDQPGTMIGPLHTEAGREAIEVQVADALTGGAELLAGGRRPEGEPFQTGWFYEPTLLLEPARDSRVAREEVFGPVLPIWRVEGLDEALELANASPFGLGSSVWTRDMTKAQHAIRTLRAGYTWVNVPQRVHDQLPFGGVGQSGLGKEHGVEALDHYQEAKAVVVGGE